MDASMGLFWEKPAGWKEMERLHRMIRDLTAPYEAMRQPAFQNLVSAMDMSYMREARRIAELCTPAFMKTLKIQSDVLKQFSATQDVWQQTAHQIAEWSNVLFDRKAFWFEPEQQNIAQELNVWSEVAGRISSVVVCELEDAGEEVAETLSQDDQKAISEEINSILNDKNWEQRFMESIQKYNKTHPLFALIIKNIFLIIIQIVIGVIATVIAQAKFPANVYEEPKVSAPIVYHIEQHQQVIIVNEIPYYYEIEVKDESTNEIKTGFVSKRSIEMIDVKDIQNVTTDE